MKPKSEEKIVKKLKKQDKVKENTAKFHTDVNFIEAKGIKIYTQLKKTCFCLL